MEPTFYRGDLILISNRGEYVAVGDIPVVWFPGEDLPFVHRAVEVCWNSDSESNYTLESVLVSLLARVLRERFQLTGA
jgi:signal peptidase I